MTCPCVEQGVTPRLSWARFGHVSGYMQLPRLALQPVGVSGEGGKMPWYVTEYISGGSRKFGGQLFAADDEQAREIANRRSIGETVLSIGGKGMPFARPSALMREPRSPESDYHTFHTLCWFAHLALASGTATPDELFGDCGVVHEWAHMLALGDVDADRLIQMVEDIEHRIPGFLGEWP
jgi:hypothetical protein